MRKLLIAGAAFLGLSACQTVSEGVGNAVNIVNAIQGAIAQTCQARVEYSFIEKLITKYTNIGARVEMIADEVCGAIDAPRAFSLRASARGQGVVVVRGVTVAYKKV